MIHRFEGGTIRTATAEDLDKARDWTTNDFHHSGKIAPEFWTEQGKGVDSYVFADEHGDLMFCRIERVARLYIQFPPATTRAMRDRIRSGLVHGMEFIAMTIGLNGFGEMLFDTESRILRNFAMGALSFKAKASTLSKRIPVWSPEARLKFRIGGVAADDAQTPAVEPLQGTLQGGQ